MQLYFYAKSGHSYGLEETKRCSAIANQLKEFNPILCTSDFRAGAFAKENLGIKKYVNIDVIRNLTNIMQDGDILIYESPEANEEMKKDISEFCSLSYDIKDIKGFVVDRTIYQPSTPTLEKTLFFGDDDYENTLLSLIKDEDIFDLNILMGHYFFLGNEKILQKHFSSVIDEENYTNTIINSKYLLTSSLQTALESLSCENHPVLIKRDDKNYDELFIKELNIPVIEQKELSSMVKEFENIILNYPKIKKIDIFDIENIKNEIKNKIDIFTKLSNY